MVLARWPGRQEGWRAGEGQDAAGAQDIEVDPFENSEEGFLLGPRRVQRGGPSHRDAIAPAGAWVRIGTAWRGVARRRSVTIVWRRHGEGVAKGGLWVVAAWRALLAAVAGALRRCGEANMIVVRMSGSKNGASMTRMAM